MISIHLRGRENAFFIFGIHILIFNLLYKPTFSFSASLRLWTKKTDLFLIPFSMSQNR